MVGKTKTPTRAEKRRMTVLKENVPCVPCLLTIRRVRMPSIQHTVSGFTRDGHDSTYSACDWHHFGTRHGKHTNQEMCGMLGPPITFGKRTYQEFFGPEALLVRIATFLVEEYEESPWLDYNVPLDLRRRIIRYWDEKR